MGRPRRFVSCSKAVNRQLFEDARFLFGDAELGLSAPRGRQPKLDAACVVSPAGILQPFTPIRRLRKPARTRSGTVALG